MAPDRVMAFLLAALMLLALLLRMMQGPGSHASLMNQLAWDGYLFVLPLLLAGFLLAGARWALMGGVIYGTIGLALDISTVIQDLSSLSGQPDALPGRVAMSSFTGLLNVLLILFGGRGFLAVGPADAPRSGPPPSPPSHPAA